MRPRGKGFREGWSQHQGVGGPGQTPAHCDTWKIRELVVMETDLLWGNVHIILEFSIRVTSQPAKRAIPWWLLRLISLFTRVVEGRAGGRGQERSHKPQGERRAEGLSTRSTFPRHAFLRRLEACDLPVSLTVASEGNRLDCLVPSFLLSGGSTNEW